MPSHQYSFYRFPQESRAYTRLPLIVRNPATGADVLIMGLVDTGADASLFPASLAIMLGHKLKGRRVRTTVTGGIENTPVIAYRHTFMVSLLSPNRRQTVWTARIEVDCLETDPPPLLGVDDFLRHFQLLIDYPRETLRLAWR